MANRERGLFRIIFKEFLRSLSPKIPKHTCVGEDYMGTKYYEIEKLKNSIHNKPNRYFVPKEKDNFEQDIPAEWEAWLRNRRKVAPTADEVNENYNLILMKKKNAAELEAAYAKETTTLNTINSNVKPINQHASLNFPVYDEYKEHGRHYKPNTKPETKETVE